jgi:hypothetical protein
MTVVAIVLSALLILEFVFAPINLWTGRTMDNYLRFTGLPAAFATRVLAPVKLVTAIVLVVGIWLVPFSIAGAVLALAISCGYLVRLAAPARRDRAGIAGFAIFGALALALLVVRLIG